MSEVLQTPTGNKGCFSSLYYHSCITSFVHFGQEIKISFLKDVVAVNDGCGGGGGDCVFVCVN